MVTCRGAAQNGSGLLPSEIVSRKTGGESYGFAQNRADTHSCFKLQFYRANGKCACIVTLL
jgi:hypothetical protein